MKNLFAHLNCLCETSGGLWWDVWIQTGSHDMAACLQMDLLWAKSPGSVADNSVLWFGLVAFDRVEVQESAAWDVATVRKSQRATHLWTQHYLCYYQAVKSGTLKQSQLFLPIVGWGLFVQREEWQHQLSRIIEKENIATAQPCHLVTR